MHACKKGIISATLMLCSVSALAGPFYLGDMADFNAYVLEDMQGANSDVEGRLAVGGNLTLQDYGLGLQVPADNTKPVVVAGNDVTMRNSRIYHGDAVAAGQIDIDETVGLYSDGAFNNTHHFYQDSSFDFAAANSLLMHKSALWGSLNHTADVQVGQNDGDIWGLTFAGSDALNIFSLDATALSDPGKHIRFDVPEDSLTIVNVYGEMVSLFETGFELPSGDKVSDNRPEDGAAGRHDGRYTNNVLFNFVDATSLVMHGIGFKGSILAPLAETTFYNGHIDGNLFVRSLGSPDGEFTGQVNNYQFKGFSQIDEPATGIAVVAGLIGLLGWQRRRLQGKAA